MSLHQDYKNYVDEKMSDYQWFQTITEVKDNLNNGYYEQSWVDVFLQKWSRRGKYDHYDAYGFAQLWSMWMSGVLAMFQIYIGYEPTADKEIKEMNLRLQQGLADYVEFDAKFDGGTQPGDGHLFINDILPIHFVKKNQDGSEVIVRTTETNDPPWSITLEAGYTEVDTTYFTLMEQLSLARWPYHSEWITVLHLDRDSIETIT